MQRFGQRDIRGRCGFKVREAGHGSDRVFVTDGAGDGEAGDAGLGGGGGHTRDGLAEGRLAVEASLAGDNELRLGDMRREIERAGDPLHAGFDARPREGDEAGN